MSSNKSMYFLLEQSLLRTSKQLFNKKNYERFMSKFNIIFHSFLSSVSIACVISGKHLAICICNYDITKDYTISLKAPTNIGHPVLLRLLNNLYTFIVIAIAMIDKWHSDILYTWITFLRMVERQ